MSLAQDVAAFGAGSAIINRVSAPIASIRDRAARLITLASLLPVAGEASALLLTYADLVDSKHPGVLSALPVTLPLMQSVYFLDQRLGVAAGASSFNDYFGALSSAETGIEAVKTAAVNALTSLASVAVTISGVTGAGDAALTSLMAVVPAPTTTDPGTGAQVTNPAYTSFLSTNAAKITSMTNTLNTLKTTVQTATTQLNGYYASIDSSYQAGLAKLKGAAFIGFINAPHPAEVQAAISATVNLGSVLTIP